MACKQGIRQNIEASKRYCAQQREYDPFRELWKSLVDRVYRTPAGYESFTEAERIYYAVNVLDSEVYNGGMHQFFWNTSGDIYQEVVDGLLELRAHDALKLLLRAKEILFDQNEPPQNREERWQAMRQYPEGKPDWVLELEEVDKAFGKDLDHLGEKLRKFAEERGLIAPFQRDSETAAPDADSDRRPANGGRSGASSPEG